MKPGIKHRLMWWAGGTLVVAMFTAPGCNPPPGDMAIPYLLGAGFVTAVFGLLLACVGSLSWSGLRWATGHRSTSQTCLRCGAARTGDFCGRCGAKLTTKATEPEPPPSSAIIE
jgi:ribosomal protein L40E